MGIEASARTHGVTDEDMEHALRHHLRAFETDDPAVTLFIGPSRAGELLEIGVVVDDGGTARDPRHAGPSEVPERLVDPMTKTRAERAAALEAWADEVRPTDLRTADTTTLRSIAELVERRDHIDEELTEAVRAARTAQRSWSEIGTMLGVSKQAAQRKYSGKLSPSA